MKVLLINPSLTLSQIGHYKKAVEKRRGAYAPLGLCYIAAALQKQGCEVKIYDCETQTPFREENLLRDSKAFDPVWVGIYTMTWTFRQASALVEMLKPILPETKFVAGGPNVSSFGSETLEYSNFDYAVFGEGEETAVELCKVFKKEIHPEHSKGLIYRDGSKIIKNEPRPFINDLDGLPFPSRDLLNMGRYFDVFARNPSFITMLTSRGCPYNCTFCDRENRMGRQWRSHSELNIIEEIKECVERYKIREVMFFDDEFIIDKDRVYDICERMLSEGLKVDWECRARVDRIDEKLVAMMKRAGCYRMRFGFESGSDRILKLLRKAISVEQSVQCAKLARKAGMEVFGYFMMGCPEETPETVEETIHLALSMDLDFAIFSKAILIPGSEIFDWGVANNHISEDHWQKYLRGEETNGAPAISTESLPEGMVDQYIKKANRAFYSRVKFFVRRLAQIRSIKQAFRQVSMAKALLFS